MLKTYKYRIYPNKPEKRLLSETLEICRLLYNRILATRRDAWKQEQKSLDTRDTQAMLPLWKKEDEQLKRVYSQILQNVNERVGIAFEGFFKRVSEGEEPGYPRFKSKGRYDSFTYPQHKYSFKTKDAETRFGYAFQVGSENNTSYLYLAKIGQVKIILHRPLPETIKTLTIKRTRNDKWYATFVCEVPQKHLPPVHRKVGIDLGLHHYMAFSDGGLVPNPRFFRKDEAELAKANRKYSAILEQCKPYWKKEQLPPPQLQHERKHRGKALCRIHERIKNRRDNFCHQLSRDIVDNYDFIALERLDSKRMSESQITSLNKGIRDAAWTLIRRLILFKAVEAGREWALVNPRHTSQRCSDCGQLVPKSLSVRIHKCPYCGLIIDRDINAALNILALGLQGAGNQPPEALPGE